MIGAGPDFTPAPGSLRIWTKAGQMARNPLDVAGGGDYVAGNVAHTAGSLGFASGVTKVTFYVEGIAPSLSLGDLRIVVKVDPDGSGKQGSFNDAVRLTDVSVKLRQVDFNGPGNVNIRINGSQDIGTPAGAIGTGDIEWEQGSRDQPNAPGKAWDSHQSAPAAFVKGNALTATVIFNVFPLAITQISIRALNRDASGATGAYGNIATTTISVAGGLATASVSTSGMDDNVDVNTLSFFWQLQGVTPSGGAAVSLPANIKQSQHRIYTLYAAPVAPMAEPWAQVLELSIGIAKLGGTLGAAAGDDSRIVAQLTRGVYNSLWTTFAATTPFINPTARLLYNPSVVRTELMGTSGAGGTLFISQEYDLNLVLSLITGTTFEEQCNDNANLMTILAASIGIGVTPLFFAHDWGPNGPTIFLNSTAPYVQAGRTATIRSTFKFHQIVSYGGLVYDTSAGPTAGGDPTMGMTFDDYLDLVFPGQRARGYVSQKVTTITIKP